MKLITDDGYNSEEIGEIIATSLVQEGPAACLLSPNVYDYIVRGICSVQAHKQIMQLEDDVSKTAIEKVNEVVHVVYSQNGPVSACQNGPRLHQSKRPH